MGLYQAEGIVLSAKDLGEADRLVSILCREQGRLRAVAKGARRPRNRLVGLTLPFNLLRLSLFAGRNLDEISQAEGIRSYRHLREDLVLLAYASYLTELAEELLPEREPNEPAFELLLRALTGLEAGHDPELLTRLFELRLLDQAGFRPAIESCLGCGRPPRQGEETVFSPDGGGLYCLACAAAIHGAGMVRLPAASLLAMREGLRGEETSYVSLDPAGRRALQRAMAGFIASRLDREPRSLKFLLRILGEPVD